MAVYISDYRLKLGGWVFFFLGERGGAVKVLPFPRVYDRAGETRVAGSRRSPACVSGHTARPRGVGADMAGLGAHSARCQGGNIRLKYPLSPHDSPGEMFLWLN